MSFYLRFVKGMVCLVEILTMPYFHAQDYIIGYVGDCWFGDVDDGSDF